MSPEIWMNKPYDARSDVWALGCLIYELAMLAPPFIANDIAGLAAKVKTAPSPRVSKHYSDDLQNLVASMLAKDPKGRPDVRTILASQAVQSRMHVLPPQEETPWAGEEMRIHMVSTIRAPAGFGMGFGANKGPTGGLALPAPNFPTAAQLARVADVGAAAAVVAAVAADVAGGAVAAAAKPAPVAAAVVAVAPRRPLGSAGGNFVAPIPTAYIAKPAVSVAPPAPAVARGGHFVPAPAAPAARLAAAVAVAQAGIAGRAQVNAQANAAAAAAAAARINALRAPPSTAPVARALYAAPVPAPVVYGGYRVPVAHAGAAAYLAKGPVTRPMIAARPY